MPDLSCPKCESSMRSYERNGVTIEQCTGCRGVFLDRGELERLIDAEGNYYEQRSEPPPPRQPDYGGHHGHHKKRKKRSFLDELFD